MKENKENSIPDPPRELADAGRDLWNSTLSQYKLDPAEMAILAQMARLTDNLVNAQEVLGASPLVVKGSRGQLVEHPLLAEVRLASQALGRLAKQLNLPQPRGGAASRRGRISSPMGVVRNG